MKPKLKFLTFLLILLSVTLTSFSDNEKIISDDYIVCNPPILSFDGVPSPAVLCSNKYYTVRISGTDNAVITSISGGTLMGKNGDDFPTNWTIKPLTTAGMTIQVYGQCCSAGCVTSSTATYTYTVLASGGPGGMCNK
jgi:hypothetical protein